MRKHSIWHHATRKLALVCAGYLALVAAWKLGERFGKIAVHDCVAIPSIAIIVPFTEKDLEKVAAAVRRWSRFDDPCSSIPTPATSPLHALFWFNRDLTREPWKSFAQVAETAMAASLGPIRHCFSSVRFDSARLSDEEDPYPFGASNMWYTLYISKTDPLKAYDYFLWAEHDLMPVRKGWMDALAAEVALHKPFFVRGSIYRGSNLDNAVKDPKKAQWVTHINGNAFYTCKDSTFRAMVKSCYYAQSSEGIHASFDLAIWMRYVASYMGTWKRYQTYAHEFQYTNFMQNYGYGLSEQVLNDILDKEPSTYMIHGDAESAGEKYKKQKASQQIPEARDTIPCSGANNCTSTPLPL